MKLLLSAVFLSFLALTSCQESNQIPEDLLMGFATAAYQIEGAWDEDGKGESVWDRLCHTNPSAIADQSSGDIAADSYHKFREDIQLLKAMGGQVYRFSLSWARLLPTGDPTNVNQAGIDHYNDVINELLANGIQPLVTLFHWDLPQRLQDLGGWPNPIMADYFYDYANLAFTEFGDRVKWWLTFNEPIETSKHYGADSGAPMLNIRGIADYLTSHTILQSHARAYRLYDEKFRPTQNGRIAITLSSGWHEPLTADPVDVQARDDIMQFIVGWYAHPIYSAEGDYPPVMRKNVDANSAAEGRGQSRLPTFTPEMIEMLKGSSDFFGLNHYTTYYVESALNASTAPNPSWDRDTNAYISQDPSWPSAASGWLKVVPWGFRRLLNWIKDEYDNIPVFVTENGFSDFGDIEDDRRIQYFNDYLSEMLNAIHEDGCNVIGYTAWSLVDDFEWRAGYTERFGIYRVDFNDPNRARTPKKSVQYFTDIINNRLLPDLNVTSYTHQPLH